MEKFITENKLRCAINVKFVPSYKIEYDKIVKKGTKQWFRLLGIIPLYKHKIKEDRYIISEPYSLETPTWFKNGEPIEYIKSKVKYNKDVFYMNGANVYKKASVTIKYSNNVDAEYYYFDTDEEATKFMDELKEKCKNVGNNLINE